MTVFKPENEFQYLIGKLYSSESHIISTYDIIKNSEVKSFDIAQSLDIGIRTFQRKIKARTFTFHELRLILSFIERQIFK